jgi:hypothetical protein
MAFAVLTGIERRPTGPTLRHAPKQLGRLLKQARMAGKLGAQACPASESSKLPTTYPETRTKRLAVRSGASIFNVAKDPIFDATPLGRPFAVMFPWI